MAKRSSKTKLDEPTKRWIRNVSDERAAANGCRFNEARGQAVIDFAEEHCVLYEGDRAGEPLVPHDWQIDVTMRLFGWEVYSEFYGRWVRRFNQASIWIPKKNKKSPTLAWWGLYLLIADGEMGQKVFTGAKNADQASISQTHAVEMVRQSPTLSAVCKINKSTLDIEYPETKSLYTVLSSDNERNQKSKEGLNGSVLIDETHVVDRRFINRIKRATISRSEPMFIEASTAGNDPDCYGKWRYEQGKEIAAGKQDVQQLFFQAYEAPQDLSDEALAKDPLKYGQLANPAWNHTIRPEEFLADYMQSKHSISELAEFKMYRLNIWQATSNPWLRSDHWAACAAEYCAEDLRGQPCWLGLDLSKTRDMTAVVAMFRTGDNQYRQLPYFWMPEVEARQKNHLVAYMNWAAAGHLQLIPGAVVQQRPIRDFIVQQLCAQFDVRGVIYDKTYAEDLTQLLVEETGMERVEFPQNMMAYAGPTAEYERLVIAGDIQHNSHPILSWQAGHVQVHNDSNANRRPVKPTSQDHKKIDGIVAAIMGLAGVMQDKNDGGSIYDSRGLGWT